MVKMYRVA